MIYYKDENIIIRSMEEEDSQKIYDEQLAQYSNCCNDDDLILYLSKKLH